jgi:hypothetical protein
MARYLSAETPSNTHTSYVCTHTIYISHSCTTCILHTRTDNSQNTQMQYRHTTHTQTLCAHFLVCVGHDDNNRYSLTAWQHPCDEQNVFKVHRFLQTHHTTHTRYTKDRQTDITDTPHPTDRQTDRQNTVRAVTRIT